MESVTEVQLPPAAALGAPLWDQVRGLLRRGMNARTFDTWLGPTRQLDFLGDRLRVEVPSEIFRDWISKTLSEPIARAFTALGRHRMTVEFVPAEVARAGRPVIAAALLEPAMIEGTDRYTKFSVSSGLLTREHLRIIRDSLALFLWCVDKQTGPHGLVLGGKPVTLAQIAERIPYSVRHIARQLERLETHEYLTVRRCQYGLTLRVNNQKKFGPHRRSTAPP